LKAAAKLYAYWITINYREAYGLHGPTEVDLLVGDASKARAKLGWQHRVSFDELVAEMVAADLKSVADERSRVLTPAD
jgi:GDP-D-mannose dehydratase